MGRDNYGTRREFLKSSAAGTLGLVVGFHVFARSEAQAAIAGSVSQFAPNAFVRIAPDDTITVVSKHLEHGMGIHTGLATLIAEELDADWSKIRVVPAPANVELYKNLFAGSQATQGSHSMSNSHEQYRKAGATARAMLIGAAAKMWHVPPGELAVEKSVVTHPLSKRNASFGELASMAATEPVPQNVTLKDPKHFTLIGDGSLHRVDRIEKTNGKAEYGIDVTMPGMLVAVVAHPPRFGGTVKSFDATKARAIPGVVDVVQISTGVAVLANSFWIAQRARDVLQIEWDESRAEKRGSEVLRAQYKALLEKPGKVARHDGDVEAALARAARVVAATYELPYLAHAPLEPVACVARLTNGRCEIWTGDTSVTGVQTRAAQMLGFEREQVEIHSVYAGGHFGRRSGTAIEVVEIVNAIEGRAPVKLQWSRAEELQNVHSGYRPMSMHKVRAGLDAAGNLIAYQHRLVSQSYHGEGSRFWVAGVDLTLVGGIVFTPYDIPNVMVDTHHPVVGVPVCPYRGTDSLCYAVETFIDELAHAAGRDPYQFRRALLTRKSGGKDAIELARREQRLLDMAASKSNWGTPLGPRRGRGIAVHHAYGTPLAQVAEVTARPDGSFKVDRVVCAIDCGIAVNPDVIRAQIEGGIAFSLGAALHSEITLKDGIIEQSNFHDYPVLRVHEMPKVEVHIVPSSEPPTGVGEPCAVPTSAAVANALFAATGRRTYRLPFARS
jgi:isoquinoline 1-oxidoreductase beta subunit